MKVICYDPTEFSQLVDGKDYPERELTEPFEFTLKTENSFVYATIREGYIWNGASIPKAFWSVIGGPFSGKYALGALIHDLLYDTHYTTRKEADEIFLQVMEMERVGKAKRWLMYQAVRRFGSKPWKKSDSHLVIMRNFVEWNEHPIYRAGNSERDYTGRECDLEYRRRAQ